VIVGEIDWSSGSIKDTHLVSFGVIGPNTHMIDETSDGFVLASARCYYGEKNVVIANADGSVIREICYGDGIADLVCFEDQVTAGYIDEGIFGNYGWREPIGAPGIVKFDLEGNIIWKNTEHSLAEVYAMTIDETGRLYFHPYSAFTVVRLSFENGSALCNPEISGSSRLFVAQDSEWVILDGGYHRRDQFYAFRFSEPGEKWRAVPKAGGEEIHGSLMGRGSKMVLMEGDSGRLLFLDWAGGGKCSTTDAQVESAN
jgi:hypothetical protein